MDCSVPSKSISSSEDKSSVNFPGIAVCEMCTAFRIRLPSGASPGSWHPKVGGLSKVTHPKKAKCWVHKEQIGVWASGAQRQRHFMGISSEHMVVSVCEKVTGNMAVGGVIRRQLILISSRTKLMMNYEIAILYPNWSRWVAVCGCFL